MGWSLVDPKYYGSSLISSTPKAAERGFGLQEGEVHGHERALWYQDAGSREQGELVLHVGDDGDLDWFQLSHTGWPHGREHIVEWRVGSELHLGHVTGDGGGDGAARYVGASPTITRYAVPPAPILREVTDYFLKQAETLEDALREAIARILWTASQDGAQTQN
jgi:hypothetical protein